MKIISFAWTSPALLAGRKNRTRRSWDDDYATRFRVGDMVQAWDKSPRFGGKRIGIIQILGLRKEDIFTMPAQDYEREGFAYFEEMGMRIRGQVPREAFADWQRAGGGYWVVDFQLMSIIQQEGVSTWRVRSTKTGVICHTSSTREGAQRWSDKFLGDYGEVVAE